MTIPEDAAIGDIIELVTSWQDVSGIPLFAFHAGERFTVLWPDLTTGGVVVQGEDELATFSLRPEQYRVVSEGEMNDDATAD